MDGNHVEGSPVPRFEYSIEKPPPLDVLESKIFAVHATPILPKGGVIVTGERETSQKMRQAASFDPTISFALGTLINPTREGRQVSDVESPYAVITPLGSLKEQLINVSPNDTFILGDYHLTKDAVVLVPEGTDTSEFPEDITVVSYDISTGLKNAVDNVIRRKKGWNIKMDPERSGIDVPATIDETDISDKRFFQELLDTYPWVSYGTHGKSEKGEAFRFGMLDSMLYLATDIYRGGNIENSGTMFFYKILIEHQLKKLAEFTATHTLSSSVMQAIQTSSENAKDWLNLITFDLQVMRDTGKRLSSVNTALQDQLIANKGNTDELRRIFQMNSDYFDDVFDGNPTQEYALVYLRNMPPEELMEFISQHESFFSGIYKPDFFIRYSLEHWLIMKDRYAHTQAIDRLLEEYLEQYDPTIMGATYHEPVFDVLSDYLSNDSNGLPTALGILQQPYMHTYLQRILGITFAEGEPTSFDAVIKEHPETAILFEPQLDIDLLTPDQRLAYDILVKSKIIRPLDEISTRRLGSFRDFRYAANARRNERMKDMRYLTTMSQPMNTIRDEDMIQVGGRLTAYELLREKFPDAGSIWEKFGLKDEFRDTFPEDNIFWQSELSFLEIYKLLRTAQDMNS